MRLRLPSGFAPVGDLATPLKMLRDFGETSRSLLVTRTEYHAPLDKPFTYDYHADGTADTASAIITDEDAQMVLIRGMTRIEQARALATSIIEASDTDLREGFPYCWRVAATFLLNTGRFAGENIAKTVHIFAHSWGSGTATALKRFLSHLYPQRTVRVYTFGAPKTVFTSGRSVGYEDYWRYTCEGDPVIHLPPTYQELPWFHWNGAANGGRFNRIIHPTAELQLGDDNQVRILAHRAGPFVRTNLDIADWMLGSSMTGNNRHSLAYYIARFERQAGLEQTGGTSEGGDWGEPQEQPMPSTSEERRTIRTRAVEVATAIAAGRDRWAQDYAATVPPAERPALRVRIGRYRRQRTVTVNGEIVAFARSRKEARATKEAILFALGQ